MKPEIEAKFLRVDVEDTRSKLQAAGGSLVHPMRLIRKEHFDYADERYKKGGYRERLRIRDEGDKCTMTYKKSSSDSNYTNEVETVIGSYDATKEILIAIGLQSVNYQESRRETWYLDEVEVVIDDLPWLDPYIEIEGPSEESIKAAAAKLGFDWVQAKFGSFDIVYRDKYPKMGAQESILEVAQVKFGEPLPDYLKRRR